MQFLTYRKMLPVLALAIFLSPLRCFAQDLQLSSQKIEAGLSDAEEGRF